MRLRFWFKSGLSTLLSVVCASLLYCLIFSLQASEPDAILTLLTLYPILFGAMLMPVMTLNTYKFNVNLAISMGSTRNEVLVGLQLFRFVTILGVLLWVSLCTLLAGDRALLPLWQIAVLTVGVFLFTCGIGSVMGVVNARWGKAATVVLFISILLVAFASGFLSAYGLDARYGHLLAGRSGTAWLVWLALGVGLPVYGLAMIPEQRTVWKFQVKL